MKTFLINKTRLLFGALAVAFLASATAAYTQESMVALGRVNSLGNLLNSANTVNGLVAANDPDVGEYVVTVTTVGAFAGNDASDFFVEASISSTSSGDETIKASVTSVTDDVLTVEFHTDEVEDASNTSFGEPRDQHFYFVIYRTPDEDDAPTASRYLIANGIVEGGGTLSGGVGIEGIEVASSQNGTGDYAVTLSKTGGFDGDNSNDYILSLSIAGASDQDQVIRGGVQSVVSDDQVVFNIHTDDIQSSTDDNLTTPSNNKFFFTIYRIPSDGNPRLSDTNLLVALARVGSNGTLLSAPSSLDGGNLFSTRNGEGDYRLSIVSAGAFEGKTDDDYVPQAFLNQGLPADEAIMTRVIVQDADTLHIDVNTNDVEMVGEPQGVPQDAGFFVVLMDATGTHRPDLRIGTKRSLSKMKGNNRYNNSGGGQQIRLKLPGTAKKKFHFVLENDGKLVDQVRLKEAGTGSKIRTKYYRITGGRQNITAQVAASGLVEDRLSPDRTVRYEGQVKYRNLDRRPTKKFRLIARSLLKASTVDVNRVKVKKG